MFFYAVLRNRSRSEPVLYGRSRSRCKGPAPGPGSTLDKTDEILNDILFDSSHIDKKLFKKRILINKWHFSSLEEGVVFKKILMVESALFIGAEARAGEKNTRSRSKMDQLRNTGYSCSFKILLTRYLILPRSKNLHLTKNLHIN